MYSQEVADQVCRHIAEGMSLRQIEAMDGMPSTSTLVRWLQEKQEFRAQYAHAREVQAELHADELVEIADSATAETVAVAKLRTEVRKWNAAKLLPRKYGDKLDLTHTGEITVKGYVGIDPEKDI